ncbi:MAG: hypothetical protein AABP62_31080 [Planctomycetota bacterium]
MEQQPNDKQSTRSAAIAALFAVSAGWGIGYALMLATGNNAVGIGMAGPIALLVNNFVRNLLLPAARTEQKHAEPDAAPGRD